MIICIVYLKEKLKIYDLTMLAGVPRDVAELSIFL